MFFTMLVPLIIAAVALYGMARREIGRAHV